MKKIITISIVSSILLMAGSPIHDLMDHRIKGKSFSGTLDDNAAAEDGLGILPLQHHTGTTEVNNELLVQKVFNVIVKNEDDKSKTSNIRTSLTNGTVGTASDLSIINNAGVTLHADGSSCNTDNNVWGQTYLNNICQGGIANGTSCNTDATLEGMTYLNGICQGGMSISIENKTAFINYQTKYIIIANQSPTTGNIGWPWVRSDNGTSQNIVYDLGSAYTTHIGDGLHNGTYGVAISQSLQGKGVIDASSSFVGIGVVLPGNFQYFSTLALRKGGTLSFWKCDSLNAYNLQLNVLNLTRNIKNTDYCSLLHYTGPNTNVNQGINYNISGSDWTFFK